MYKLQTCNLAISSQFFANNGISKVDLSSAAAENNVLRVVEWKGQPKHIQQTQNVLYNSTSYLNDY